MINAEDPLEVRVVKQQKIIDALMRRAERSVSVDNSAYSLFNSAISLQGEVWAKNKDLEVALRTLGKASGELQTAQTAREEVQKTLADAVDAMESGFAIFSNGRLNICNALFSNFLPDLSRKVRKGMLIENYFAKLRSSRFVDETMLSQYPIDSEEEGKDPSEGEETSFVLPISGDRWFQITRRRTSAENTVVLQTEVTQIIRRDRAERDKMRDDQANVIQSAFDHMNFGVCTFTDKGRLIRTNAHFRKLMALPMRLCAADTDLHQLFNYLDGNRALKGLHADLSYVVWAEEILGPRDAEWSMRHRSGRILAMNMHLLPNGARLLIVRDITDEMQTMETLENRVKARTLELTLANQRLKDQMEELEHIGTELEASTAKAEAAVRSKTRFLAAASHDLLQPINAAKLYISMLSEGCAGTPLEDTAERLERALGSTEWLLQSLLEVSRLESTGADFDVNCFAIQPIFDAILSDASGLAQSKGVALRCVPTSLWTTSDPRYLLRSIQNLVVNAIQYTPAGGHVLLGCRNAGDRFSIEVHDTGPGISIANQKRIFEAFTRLDGARDRTGMGLGLSIVDHACRHLGHEVKLDSELGKGSAFRILVPLSRRQTGQVKLNAPSPHLDREDLNLIVVVVENDPEGLYASVKRLEAWGCSVLAAASTKDAEELVQDLASPPDLMLVDYQLDHDDTGIQTISTLRASTQHHIPAIMITATRGEFLTRKANSEDFTIMTKPVQLSRLRSLISWKVRNLDKGVG